MADFTPKKESGNAKGDLPMDNAERQSPPRLYLEHHHLEKLGMSKMPPVGSKVRISGLAHVGATSENHDDMASPGKGKGNMRRSMTLHLHKMEIGKDGVQGVPDVEQEEQSKAGAKAEMDKALARRQGSESGKTKGAGGKLGHQDG